MLRLPPNDHLCPRHRRTLLLRDAPAALRHHAHPFPLAAAATRVCVRSACSRGHTTGAGSSSGSSRMSDSGANSDSSSPSGTAAAGQRSGNAPAADTVPTKALSFENTHGERLAANLVDASSEDVVIFCHGYAATKVRAGPRAHTPTCRSPYVPYLPAMVGTPIFPLVIMCCY